MTDPLVPDRCLICDTVNGYELVTREDEHIVRHGIRFTVAGLKWYECRACHEVINTPTIVDANAMLIDAAYAARREGFRNENNLLDPTSIKTIRKTLGETQESLSLLLGVGSNGLQKYETDKSCPSKPAELLLRVLAVQPSYLSTLKLIAAMPASSFAQPDQILANCEILVTLGSATAFGNWSGFGSFVQQGSAGAVFGMLQRKVHHPSTGESKFSIESAGINDFVASAIFHKSGLEGGGALRGITKPTRSALTDSAYLTSAKAETQGCHYVH